MENILNLIQNLLIADFRTATPILLAGIGLIYMYRAGIVNIGVEGTMLIGAFAGSYGAYIFNNVWMGILVAAIVGGIVGAIFAFLIITIKADQIVTGVAINIFAIGLTTTLNRILFGVNTSPPDIPSIGKITIPFLSDIPFVGRLLFNQLSMVYIALLLVPITYYVFYKTTIGLKIRAVGDHPKAADTAGVNVFKVRYWTTIFGSMLAGIGGAFLSTGILSFFTEDMVAGRGFIALAAVIFGNWNPWGVLGASLLFGFGDAIQIRIQAMGSNIPYQFLIMIPYLLTITALAGLVGKVNPPEASAEPYIKEE
ncbi:MAG: ABC transporter permease [Halanaerobiales bacterium]|nr:ABC transporter permease [Halanaerobiales bacterium]